jgi:hypothetical protein
LLGGGGGAPRRRDQEIGFLPLAAGQVVLFAGAEVAERVAAGVPLPALTSSPDFAVGVAVQVAVAGLALLVLGRWARVVRAVAAPARRRSARQATTGLALTTVTRTGQLAVRCVRSRAPPALALD